MPEIRLDLHVPDIFDLPRAMIFVDGENLAIRYGEMLNANGGNPHPSIRYLADVFVWSTQWGKMSQGRPAIMRKYYYTSAPGDSQAISNIEDELKSVGIEAPRVFHKEKQSKRTKSVDITLTTDMLLHAAHKSYDIAVLVSGDADTCLSSRRYRVRERGFRYGRFPMV